MVRDGFLWAVDLEDVGMHAVTFDDLEEVVWLAIDAALDAGLDEDSIGFPHRLIMEEDGALRDLLGEHQGYMPLAALEVHPQPPTEAASTSAAKPELEVPELEAPSPEVHPPAPEFEELVEVPAASSAYYSLASAADEIDIDAFGLAKMVGDRTPFLAHVATSPRLSFRVHKDHTWLAINFDAISRFGSDGERAFLLKVDAHITLMCAPPLDPEAVSAAVAHGEELVNGWLQKKQDISHFTGQACFIHTNLCQPNYAWADLLVGSRLYDTCHRLAAQLSRHMGTRWVKGWNLRREFHISFSTRQ